MPYFPEGVANLPENRFIILANGLGDCRAVDESVFLRGTTGVPADWMSPSLNREDRTRIYTLRKVLLFYEASDDTTIEVRTSGDGGETFPSGLRKTLNILKTIERHRRAITHFNTSGFDLRLQFYFNSIALVNVIGYVAYIQPGTDHAVRL